MVNELSRLLDTLPGLIWTAGPDAHADFINARYCEYTGIGPEEALGLGWQTVFHPDDVARARDVWGQAALASRAGEVEVRLRRFDGEYRWFLIRFVPLLDGDGGLVKWCGINTDIDDRKRAERELQSLETNLRKMCESIPGFVCMLSPDGHAKVYNQRVLNYFGKTAEELARSPVDSVHPDDMPRSAAAFKHAVATGTPYEIEERCRRADGVYRWFLVRAFPARDADGLVTGWFLLMTDVDDRKHAEEAIRASERNLKLIIDTIPTLAWSALPDGSAEFLNGHYLDFIGMTLERARGWGWSEAVHPDDWANFDASWHNILRSERPGETEARLRRTDGTYRWFLIRANPLRDDSGRIVKWYGTNTDIDDRKRAEDQLRRKEAVLAEGERLNLTGTFYWRLDTNAITFSEQLCRIFELDPGAALTIDQVVARVHPEDVPLVSEKIELARRGINDHHYECRLRMPDGSIRYLRTNAFGVQSRGGPPEYIGAMQDITERRLSEEALGKVRSELAHMTRVASLGALTASIAHEVNQPLSGIIMNANTCLRMLAAEPPNVNGARETVRRTMRDGHRAAEVIVRLRSLFAKKGDATEIVDLNEATREVVALSRSELQRGRVILHTELESDLPAVIGDRVQLQQVILNLLLNAAAAMNAVTERQRELFVKTEREGDDRVRMTVSDTGTGLDPQELERLFEAFYTTKPNGMGLGLYVSRSIIESHRGHLRASANPGPGATFSFSIPSAPPVVARDA